MPALAKVQRDFCQFMLGHGHEDFMLHMKSTSLPKEALLDVHYTNIISAHHRSLESDYPLVFSIVGNAMARQMVRTYVETYFPCTGILEEWGGGFVSFIQRFEPAATWAYLAELAQYEWAKHIAYGAPEDTLLTQEDMKRLVELDQKELRFHFQKSCQLLAFLHPIQEIIAAHEQNRAQVPNNTKGTSYALIVKNQGTINIHWLSASLFIFINRLKEGQDIEVAYAAAQVLESKFDAQEAFSFLLHNPILRR